MVPQSRSGFRVPRSGFALSFGGTASVRLSEPNAIRSARRLALELAQQPQLRDPPVTLDRVSRHREDLRGFLDAQPAEEPHLDDAALAQIDRRQRVERAVEG